MKTLLSKPYFLVPLVLAGISINGALVIGGLSLVGRLLAPEVPVEVTETKPQPLAVQPTRQGASPESTAPEPVTVRLQDGLDLGYKAAVMAKTAQSPEEWARVSLKWAEAIRKLKEIPGSSPEYSAAQAKITEYLMNAQAASSNGVTQDIAQYAKSLNTSVDAPDAPVAKPATQSLRPQGSSVNALKVSVSDFTRLMDDRISIYSVDAFPELSFASDKYRITAAILAYLQSISIKNTAISMQLPWLMINGEDSCKQELSIGVYYPDCSLIGVDFTDGELSYEKPEEIITVIAHEWGHHLIKIANLNVSRNEGEIVSDCFAGLAMGFYYKQNMITLEELDSAAKMMIQLGNNSMTGIHPNSQTRFKAFIGAFASIAVPDHGMASLYGDYCASLDQILDKNKIATAGY